nr:isochorismate synthase [Auraticoccus cholistanensis]
MLVHSSTPLFVRSTELAEVGLDDLLALLEAGPAAGVEQAWLRGPDAAVAGGEAARWAAEPGQGVADAAGWWASVVERLEEAEDSSGVPATAFGSFCFDPARTRALPVLVLPEWTLVHRHGVTTLVEVAGRPFARPPRGREELLAGLPAAGTERAGVTEPLTVSERAGSLDADGWADRVAQGVKRILAGELDKVVLARQVAAVADRPLPLGRLARRLHEQYPRCWTFLVDGLVGASPEMLVRREDGLVTSRVLAGTIGVHGATTPETLATALASSSKDLQEHEYAVASVAEALSPFCTGMNVPDAPYVLELPNVLHLATDVTAVAAAGTSVLELVAALHPSAAVCGTPTEVARELVAELEELDRGRYSGPVGWVDAHGDGAFAIALRCGQLDTADPTTLHLYAGCGIVADSDPDAEVAESEAKLVPMRDALRAVVR